MGLEVPTYISDLVVTNPLSSDNKSLGDDHLRAIKTAARNTFPNADRPEYFSRSVTKTANYTVLSTDLNKLILGDATAGSITLTLPTLAAANDGWAVDIVKSDSSANTVTVAGTINGVVNFILSYQYERVTIRWSGTAWYADLAPPAMTDAATADLIELFDVSARLKKRITLADMLGVINLLTADASPDSAADYLVSYDASASAVKKILLANLPSSLPRGYISGCILSNGTDATNDINLTGGKCRDSTDTVDIVVSANTAGKQLDSPWVAAATTNTGMRNSAQNGGSVGNFSYHIYAARTLASSAATIYAYMATAGTDGDSAAAIATMLTALQAETGGASYVYARRLGTVVREGAVNVAFTQYDNYFQRNTPGADVSVTNPGTGAATRTLLVPLGVVLEADVYAGSVTTGGAAGSVLLTALTATASTPSQTLGDFTDQSNLITSGVGIAGGRVRVFTNTSGQIRAQQSASDAGVTQKISTRGWTDVRGRN